MSERAVNSPAPRDQAEIADLRARLAEAEETLDAIRNGEVDALIVNQGRDQAIYTLENADRPYRLLVEQMQEGALTISADGRVLYCNRRMAELLDAELEDVLGAKLSDYAADEHRQRLDTVIARATTTEVRTEINFKSRSGTRRPVQVSFATLAGDAGPVTCGIVSDLTDRVRQNKELQDLNEKLLNEMRDRGLAEAQLRQAQKMEAVGQLTGGLAHDFNNLLAAISGNLQLLERRISQGRLTGIERYLENAGTATQRAAALTQRLLAFSRRQTLDPRPTDINKLIAGMQALIRGSVGPDVTLEFVGAVGLWTARVDATQLEGAILNLCINARDAMAPNGGRITIETANKWLDDRNAAERELPAGQYLSICVTDTGSGMTPEVEAHAFDPFYTTKPIGKGTGLGLSMVYGFARQSGGQIRIYTEIGKGTTMCLYLPRYHGEAERDHHVLVPLSEHGGGETVLVIDDEAAIRAMLVEILRECGYRTLEAGDGPAGLQILQSNAPIDLLISDVGLPGGMNGRQVADAARVLRPGLKVLFITGYAENAVLGNGQLEPGMEVVTKPFDMSVLADKVRELIDRG